MPPARVWEGNDQLRRLLVPLGELKPHPRNPRRGNVQVISESLDRFGQQRPILALPDGTIVAGRHTYAAAEERGWSHIAVVRSDLSGEEVEAYLLADNRTSDQAEYDDEPLAELLRKLVEDDRLYGTGYKPDDLDDVLARLVRGNGGGGGGRGPGERDMVEVVLLYSPEQRDELNGWLTMIAREKEIDGISRTVYEAARIVASSL